MPRSIDRSNGSGGSCQCPSSAACTTNTVGRNFWWGQCLEKASWIGCELRRSEGNTRAEIGELDDDALEAVGANPELLDTLPLKPADDTGVTLDGTPLHPPGADRR